MTNPYKEAFSQIIPSKDFEEKIFNATVNRKAKVMTVTSKAILSCSIAVAILLGSIISVSAFTDGKPYKAISSFLFGDNEETTTEEITAIEELQMADEPTEAASEEAETEPLTEVSELYDEEPTEKETQCQKVSDNNFYNEWQEVDGIWYYYNGNGNKVTEWNKIDGDWYYFFDDGSLAVNQTIGIFYVDNGGRWVEDYNEANYSPDYSNSNANNNYRQNIISPDFYSMKTVQKAVITKDDQTITVEDSIVLQNVLQTLIKESVRVNTGIYTPSSKIIYRITLVLKDDTRREIIIFYDDKTGNQYAHYDNSIISINEEELNQIWEQLNS